MDDEEEKNPWTVTSIDDFLYFCCPQCDTKKQSRESFLEHAFEEHPKSKDALGNLMFTQLVHVKTEVIERSDNGLDCEDQNYEEGFEETNLDMDFSENESDIDTNDMSENLSRYATNLRQEIRNRLTALRKPNVNESIKRKNGFRIISKSNPKKKYLHQTSGDTFNCPDCDKKFENFSLYVTHCRIGHTKSELIKKEVEKESIATSEKVAVKQNKSEELFQDSDCADGNSIKDEDIYDDMDKSDSGDSNEIKKPKIVSKKKSFKRSMKPLPISRLSPYIKPSWTCEYCGKVYNQKHNLRAHIDAVHLKTNNKELTCDICEKLFFTKVTLRKHKLSVHDGIKEHICFHCGHAFADIYSMNNHIQAIHDRPANHPCHLCDQKFTLPKYLKQHIMSVHESDQNYKCDQCGRFFSKRYKLKNHIEMTHEKKYIYNCDLCDKSYNCISNLNKHKRTTHERIKKFKCEPCNKSYAEKFGLECHMKSKAHLKKMNSTL